MKYVNKGKISSSNQCSSSLRNKYHQGYIPVIPDIKCKSPAEGDLMGGRDPIDLAKALEAAGAPVISVVTEAKQYGGSLELLFKIAKAVSVPVLRKDFITSKENLLESKDKGANGVLLISSILEKKQLFKLIDKALSIGIEPLVEIHTEEELIAVRDLSLSFIGINNRDIIKWEMDNGTVNTTENLAKIVPKGTLAVSESSISSPNDIYRAIEAGAHCVLVGTTILKAKDSVEMYRQFSRLRRKL